MTNYRRPRLDGATVFVTLALADRSLSLLSEHLPSLRSAVAEVRSRYPFRFVAAAVMPDHLHWLLELPAGDGRLGIRLGQIKGRFSRDLPPRHEPRSPSRVRRGERGVWQRRFFEHTIRDSRDLAAHVDYIHINPVKHGLARRAVDWPHSSIHRYIDAGRLSSDWACDPAIDRTR